jgi:hypothetical protein
MSLAPKNRADLLALIALACGGLVLLAVISKPYWQDVALCAIPSPNRVDGVVADRGVPRENRELFNLALDD